MRALKIVAETEAREPDDSEVIERILGGDREAYAHFVRRYQGRVFGLALRMLRDRGEAESVAQDAFVRAYQALGDFRGGSSFGTWVSRIAVNACRDRLKRKRLVVYFHQSVASDPEDTDPVELAAASDPSPERVVLSQEIRRRLTSAMDALSPKQKAIFILKHLEERSIPEIANLTGLDAGTIKSHLFRAASKLRKRLADLRRPS